MTSRKQFLYEQAAGNHISIPLLAAGKFYGQRENAYKTHAAGVMETFYSPSFKIPRHSHEGAFFGLVLEGAYQEIYDRRVRECRPSTLLFHPAGEVHSETHYDTNVRIFSIEPAVCLLQQLNEYEKYTEAPLEARGGTLLETAVKLYREFRQPDALTGIAIEGLMLELLVDLSRRQSAPDKTAPDWLRKVKELLHDQYLQTPSLTCLAAEVGRHPAQLARAFRRHYHCTVGDYLRSLRLEHAKNELRFTDLPIVEIALATGYSDQSHFSTAFKRHAGTTPAECRRNFKKCK